MTIREQIATLPEWIQKLANKYEKDQRWGANIFNFNWDMAGGLFFAFCWENSDEGWVFWSSVANHLMYPSRPLPENPENKPNLYAHRLALTAALFNEWAYSNITKQAPVPYPKHDVHKSRRHHDGELCFGGGWFIVCATLPTGQISYHYEDKYWDLFRIPEYETAKHPFDGHTSNDVVERLKRL